MFYLLPDEEVSESKTLYTDSDASESDIEKSITERINISLLSDGNKKHRFG